MRKVLYVVLSILVLSACGAKKNTNTKHEPIDKDEIAYPIETEVTTGDFVYRLYSEKEIYEEYAMPDIYAELVYIGNEESIDISHAASPFYFPIHEKTRDYEIDYAMNEPLITTTLQKGEPLREKYSFAGGYSDQNNQEYIDFIDTILNEGFPTGEYTVNGMADFFTKNPKEATDPDKFNMNAKIGFTIK